MVRQHVSGHTQGVNQLTLIRNTGCVPDQLGGLGRVEGEVRGGREGGGVRETVREWESI